MRLAWPACFSSTADINTRSCLLFLTAECSFTQVNQGDPLLYPVIVVRLPSVLAFSQTEPACQGSGRVEPGRKGKGTGVKFSELDTGDSVWISISSFARQI